MVVFPFFPLKRGFFVKITISPALHGWSERGWAEGARVTKLQTPSQLIHLARLLAISEEAHRFDLFFSQTLNFLISQIFPPFIQLFQGNILKNLLDS